MSSVFRLGVFAGIERAHPKQCLSFDGDDFGPVDIVAVGKAAITMAHVAQEQLQTESCWVLGPTDSPVLPNATQFFCTHPLVEPENVRATNSLLDHCRSLPANRTVVVLLSGGASAMLCSPTISLKEYNSKINELLLGGHSIKDINDWRTKHCHAKGGKLAQAISPARCLVYCISDVANDDIHTLGSGPCAFSHKVKNTPAPRHNIVANNFTARRATLAVLTEAGILAMDGGELYGYTNQLTKQKVELLSSFPPKTAIISGGEGTVHVKNASGRGGPNLDFLLRLALSIPPHRKLTAIAVDTDGRDGNSGMAGGIVTPTKHRGIWQQKSLFEKLLDENQTARAFKILQATIPGPLTGTNVNDLRIVHIES